MGSGARSHNDLVPFSCFQEIQSLALKGIEFFIRGNINVTIKYKYDSFFDFFKRKLSYCKDAK